MAASQRLVTMMAGLSALLLAGLLLIPGNGWLVSPAHAQSDSGKLSDQQYQELQQKRQEQWQESEQEDKDRANTAKRLQDAEKRKQDAEKRQRDAEKQLRELQK